MTINFNCKGCKDRFVGCHSTCADYQAKKYKDAMLKEEKAESYHYVRESMAKWERKNYNRRQTGK